MNTSEILKDAILACEAKEKDMYYKFNHMYSFATENISSYIKYFDLRNKSLLTVGSSADQVINAILHDCKEITLYDIVPTVKYYYFLKYAAMLNLKKDKYLRFFKYRNSLGTGKNPEVFNINSYNKLKDTLRLLDYESFLYFDELFNTFEAKTISNALFDSDEWPTKIIRMCNDYLKSDLLYEETRNKIKKVEPTFICGDIFNLDGSKLYDNIWLSNIATWLTEMSDIKRLIENSSKSLKDNGKMLASYLYCIDEDYKKGYSPVYNLEELYKELENYNLDLKKLVGVEKDSCDPERYKDAVLILKK